MNIDILGKTYTCSGSTVYNRMLQLFCIYMCVCMLCQQRPCSCTSITNMPSLFIVQVKVSQTTNGVEYTGSIVCPPCAEICYVSIIIVSTRY